MASPLWSPSPDRMARSRLTAFIRGLSDRTGREFPDYAALHQFSVEEKETFWSAVWDFCGVAGDRGGQIEPVVLFAVNGYWYGGKRFDCTAKAAEIAARLPSLRRTVMIPLLDDAAAASFEGSRRWNEWQRAQPAAVVPLDRRPFDHPL